MMMCSTSCFSSKGGSDFTSSPEPAAASRMLCPGPVTSFAGDTLLLIGLTYNTAPVETREKLAVSESENGRAVEELCSLNHVGEAAILSTCNRVEVYVVTLSMQQALIEVTQWMAKRSGIDVSELKWHLFTRRGSDAVHHLFRVSAGIDSLVVGESQILAQVKQVARVGNASKGHGKIMTLLFNRAIEVGKRVRTQTGISSGSVSVSASAIDLALSKLHPAADFPSARVLVVGAGKTGRLVIKHLVSRGSKRIVVVNRSEEKVDAIRKELKGGSIELIHRPTTEMLGCAAEADVVFTCTSSETPLFLKRDVEPLPPLGDSSLRRLFVDFSVPRNVGSCVSEAVGVARVLDVDDLKEAMEANLEKRRGEVIQAESIIGENLHRSLLSVAALGRCSRSLLSVAALGRCSRSLLSVAALGRCSRSLLSVAALGRCSRSLLSVAALGRCSRSLLSVAALGRCSRSLLSVAALGRCSRCSISCSIKLLSIKLLSIFCSRLAALGRLLSIKLLSIKLLSIGCSLKLLRISCSRLFALD
ncbi:hypothetical protein H6P81_018825 [Aristolochia fimbriata]|uniref:glutamyl-tRNA reductase n=1 Tax=Aristolochia fimbriata TaxID=158543 RepID=A0AAV7E3L4_ARIFI|nr:hypothetical protein H6P81_018825 [Aristolochia fimbriata]